MNTLYPDATPEELQLSDNICIICREDMVSSSKKLPCGHIFHTICLRSWFQRQQTCPTCRLNILRTPVAAQSQPINAQREAVQGAAPAGDANAGPPAANAGQAGVVADGGVAATIAAPQIGNNLIPPAISIPTLFNLPMPGMMMPPPFMMPPPPIPPGLDRLSEEELRLLEGTERRNVEERIKFLRNVQTLLDASSALMSQYQAISVQYPIPVPPPPPPQSQPAAEEEKKPEREKEHEIVAGSSSKQAVAEQKNNLEEAAVNVMDKVSIRDVIEEEEGESATAQSSSSSSSAPPSPNDEHEEIRRRRLEKFAKLGD